MRGASHRLLSMSSASSSVQESAPVETCNMRACSICKTLLPPTAFYRNKAQAFGLSSYCKQCSKKYTKAYAERNRDSLRRMRRKNLSVSLIASAKSRARKRGLEFDLDSHRSDIKRRVDSGECELTGVRFDTSGNIRTYKSPSLDRINSSRGYTYDNVRVVCWGINAALGQWGSGPLHEMIDGWVLKHAEAFPCYEVPWERQDSPA